MNKKTDLLALESILFGIVQAVIREGIVQLSMMNGEIHVVTKIE